VRIPSPPIRAAVTGAAADGAAIWDRAPGGADWGEMVLTAEDSSGPSAPDLNEETPHSHSPRFTLASSIRYIPTSHESIRNGSTEKSPVTVP